MKAGAVVCLLLCLLSACGNRRLSNEVLAHKIDSVRMVEQERQLRLKGIELGEASPFQLFYDSLGIQALPVDYSEDYVKYLPGYTLVPMSIVSFLELEGRESPKAIALPETMNSRLVLLAADLGDGEYELWLYSLDSECYPVDKLLLYEPQKISETKLQTEHRDTYFSITSDYEISVMEYTDDNDRLGQLSTFLVDESRQFVEREQL